VGEWASEQEERASRILGEDDWNGLSRDGQTNTSTLHSHTKRAWIVRLEDCGELKNGACTQNGSEYLPLFFSLVHTLSQYLIVSVCDHCQFCLPVSLSAPRPTSPPGSLHFFSATYSFIFDCTRNQVPPLSVSPSIFVHVVLI
jgi:hypothetical protein